MDISEENGVWKKCGGTYPHTFAVLYFRVRKAVQSSDLEIFQSEPSTERGSELSGDTNLPRLAERTLYCSLLCKMNIHKRSAQGRGYCSIFWCRRYRVLLELCRTVRTPKRCSPKLVGLNSLNEPLLVRYWSYEYQPPKTRNITPVKSWFAWFFSLCHYGMLQYNRQINTDGSTSVVTQLSITLTPSPSRKAEVNTLLSSYSYINPTDSRSDFNANYPWLVAAVCFVLLWWLFSHLCSFDSMTTDLASLYCTGVGIKLIAPF